MSSALKLLWFKLLPTFFRWLYCFIVSFVLGGVTAIDFYIHFFLDFLSFSLFGLWGFVVAMDLGGSGGFRWVLLGLRWVWCYALVLAKRKQIQWCYALERNGMRNKCLVKGLPTVAAHQRKMWKKERKEYIKNNNGLRTQKDSNQRIASNPSQPLLPSNFQSKNQKIRKIYFLCFFDFLFLWFFIFLKFVF